jgi:hypothetical protein
MLQPYRIYAGSQVDIPFHVETSDGTDIDPATVSITVLTPDLNSTTYVYGTNDEVTKQSVGDYTARIIATMPGRWKYRWLTTGSGTVVALEGAFNVQYSAFIDDVFQTRDYS